MVTESSDESELAILHAVRTFLDMNGISNDRKLTVCETFLAFVDMCIGAAPDESAKNGRTTAPDESAKNGRIRNGAIEVLAGDGDGDGAATGQT